MLFDTELSINIIISGLPADYNQFVLSYQMNGKETSIMELYSLLQTAEQGIKKGDVPSNSAAHVLTVGHNPKKRKTSHSNWKGKALQGKSDRGSKRKVESEIAPTSDPKEVVCFYCNTKGHWKRSCPKYLKDLKDGKVEKGGHSGLFMIELHNTTTSDSWVLDTGCGTHISTVLQGLKESRRLKHEELNLVMGNRKITHVTRIGKYELMLKSEVRIDLNNYCLFVSPYKGIYETVKCISNNGNVILNVGSSNELDKSKFWHSRLGHVNKKCIAQLQKDGVLESFDFKSDDIPLEGIKRYQNEVENQLDRKIKLTPPGKPQLNGVAERRNKTLLGVVQSMMCRATLPISFWGYALETVAHILNFIPTKKDNVVFIARRGVFLEREMISKEDNGSKIDLEEIQESADEEPIVERVSKPSQDPQFYYRFPKEETILEIRDVFMAQPEGFENEKYHKRVCKLQKAIYGLKQASRSWNISFHEKVTQFGFSRSEDESDVSFALSMVSRHQQNPSEGHWTFVKNILRYLRNTKDRFLVYGGEKELRVTGYCDVVQDPIEVFFDNKSIVALTKDPRDHIKSKHIERKYHFVRSKVKERDMIVKHIQSKDNPADPFTKALAKSRHDEHARSIGLKDKIKI
ncbi:retrotransposon protein, putative, ty1-copia subclass [Tanacetum coccineum]